MYQTKLDNILSGFDNIKEDDIRETITNCKTLSDCMDEIVNKSDYSYYPVKISLLSNHDTIIKLEKGIILLGYYSEKPISFHINFNNSFKERIKIPTHKTFVYAINNTYPYILMNCNYKKTDTFIISDINECSYIYLIYGVMAFNDRMFLLRQNNDIVFIFDIDDNTFMIYKNNICEHTYINNNIQHLSLKKLHVYQHNIQYYIIKSKERQDLFLKELIEKTWHPSRFMSWCLPYNENI